MSERGNSGTEVKALNEELLAYVKTLEAALNEKEFHLDSAQKDLETYKKKLQTAIDIADNLTVQKDAATNLFNGNMDKQAKLNEKVSMLQGELLLIQSSQEATLSALQKAEGQVKILTSERDGLNKYVEELNTSLEEAKGQVMAEEKNYERALAKSREDASRRADMEEENADLTIKVDMLEAEKVRLEGSLRRSKDLGMEAQEALDIAENRIASLEGEIEGARKETSSLRAQMDRLEGDVVSLKAAADEADKVQAKGEADRKVLLREYERLKEHHAALVNQERQVQTQAALEKAQEECEETKKRLEASEGKWKNTEYELESHKTKLKALQKRLDESIAKGNQEREMLVDENEEHVRVIAGLRAESEANNRLYLQTLETVQESVCKLRQEAQEGRTFSRSLRSRLTKLKARVTRECEYNLDADDNLRKELIRVFEIVSAQARKVQGQLRTEDEEDKRALEKAEQACALLTDRVAQQAEELREGKQRYEQLLAKNNFQIIDLKKEKKALEDIVDGRDEKLRQYVAQIDDGRATIEHLHADMTEARAAYEDLSRSTMEVMGQAERDGGHWMRERAEMKAMLGDRDAEIAHLRTIVEGVQGRGRTDANQGLSREEAQKLASSFETSQLQIRQLVAQKAELLERVIELTSKQAPPQTPEAQSPHLPPPPPDAGHDDNDGDITDLGAEAGDLHVSTDDDEGSVESDSSSTSGSEAAALAGAKLWSE